MLGMERLKVAHTKSIVVFWTLTLCFQSIGAEYDNRVDYEVEGDGFHRTIRYRIELEKFDLPSCYVALQLSPDPTLYVNVDELADLRRRGETVACSEGEENVELFAEKAKSQNITVCTEYKKPAVYLSLPLHQRYRLPKEDQAYVNVTLPDPVLLVGCHQWSKDHDIRVCSACDYPGLHWGKLSFSGPKNKYVWTVAIGDLSHVDFVRIVTIGVVWLGTIVILLALWLSRRANGEKRD